MRPPSIPTLLAAALSLLAIPALAQDVPEGPTVVRAANPAPGTTDAAPAATVPGLDAELRALAAGADAARRTDAEADREALRALLARPDFRAGIAGLGLDGARLDARLATLSPERLAELARHVEAARAPGTEAADGELVGGQYVVISTTAIIIALLVLIMIEM